MGLFDFFKKNDNIEINFEEIDSNEKAIALAKKRVLSPLYLMPLRFNGEESVANRLFVPPAVVKIKDGYDDIVEDLLVQGKISGYSCTPEYKGNRKTVFTQTIEIW